MKDKMLKALCFNDTVRVYCANTTEMASHAKKIHNLYPTSSVVFGELLTISAIMGKTYKTDDEITIRLEGNGPCGKAVVVANNIGVRGYIENKEVLLKYNDGKLKTAMAIGNSGLINVTKKSSLRPMPYTSTCEIIGKELAEDFTYYFSSSEQIPSSVGLGYKIDNENNVLYSGGFLLQIMPGCSDETIDFLQAHLQTIPGPQEMFDKGYSLEDMICCITADNYRIIEEDDIKYYCPCSKDRFRSILKTLKKDDIKEMIDSPEECETVCNFCKKKYVFSKDELKELL